MMENGSGLKTRCQQFMGENFLEITDEVNIVCDFSSWRTLRNHHDPRSQTESREVGSQNGRLCAVLPRIKK